MNDARENMQLNGISNVDFYAGDLAKVLDEEFIKAKGMPNESHMDDDAGHGRTVVELFR